MSYQACLAAALPQGLQGSGSIIGLSHSARPEKMVSMVQNTMGLRNSLRGEQALPVFANFRQRNIVLIILHMYIRRARGNVDVNVQAHDHDQLTRTK
jgi:hypothetical protein